MKTLITAYPRGDRGRHRRARPGFLAYAFDVLPALVLFALLASGAPRFVVEFAR